MILDLYRQPKNSSNIWSPSPNNSMFVPTVNIEVVSLH